MGPIKRYKYWKEWRKVNKNTKLYQWLVLFGFVKSGTFEVFVTYKMFCEGIEAFDRKIRGV